MKHLRIRTEAFDVIAGRADAPILVTCEHASQRMPSGWAWSDADRRLIDTHWAFDLGAAELARDLASAFEAPAVLTRYTRLLIDPNRPEDSPTSIREHAEGAPIAMNAALAPAERTRRIERLLQPFHAAVDREVAACRAPILFSMHTFTPLYEGQPREVEVGVLFNREEALAERLAEAIAGSGFRVALNEPYSGRAGLMYSVERHADAHGRRAIELEVRQDLAVDPSVRRELNGALMRFFGEPR